MRIQGIRAESATAGVERSLAEDASQRQDPLGDSQRAFLTLLFNKYRGPLYSYIASLVSSKEDAADLLQESYYRLLRHSTVVRLEIVARTYLYQTATNLARDYFRRRISHCTKQHIDIAELGIACDRWTPESEIAWQQTLAALRGAIKRLAPMTRRVFLLSRLRNKTYPEIAASLGVSTRTVERKMSEAIEALTSCIGGTK